MNIHALVALASAFGGNISRAVEAAGKRLNPRHAVRRLKEELEVQKRSAEMQRFSQMSRPRRRREKFEAALIVVNKQYAAEPRRARRNIARALAKRTP